MFGPRIRGFRPRSDVPYTKIMAAVVGIISGVYIFSEPLELAAKDVEREKGGCARPPGGAAAGGGAR